MPDIRKGETAALANANLTEFVLTQGKNGSKVKIKTASGNAGTIQFGVGISGSAPTLSASFAYGSSQQIDLEVGRNQVLFAKASAGTQSFTVEY
jgi:hypothetical protein